MRTIAIGDIHGCDVALNALLDAIQPCQLDQVVTLGDVIDRGPGSCTVVERLLELSQICELISINGNHEMMLLAARKKAKAFEKWVFNGGDTTLESYGGLLKNIPKSHFEFFDRSLRFFESDTHVFVHANYEAHKPFAQQNDSVLQWRRLTGDNLPGPHVSGKTVICGHSPQSSGRVLDFGYLKMIDTFCYGGRWLTALDIDNGELWQASQTGKVRNARLLNR